MKNRQIMGVLTFLILGTLLMSGCTGPKSTGTAPVTTPAPQIVYVTVTATPPETTASATPVKTTITTIQDKITDGFWCRDTTMNIGKAPTNVRECYQFFTDGTFKWGYSPGRLMGKSPSCSSPNVKCEYSFNAKGQYEVQGGYFYTKSGDTLIDPHDPPYFQRSWTGIP
jgi:hypothetical protein